MKATELRIGNKILFLNKEVIVERIENLDNRQQMYWIKPKGLISSKIIHFSGIEFTHDFLISSGLNKFNLGNYFLDINGFELEISFSMDRSWLDYSEIDCTHVHQLQNLYFALTGKELQQTNN